MEIGFWLMACGPLVIALAAWANLARTWRSALPSKLAVLTLCVVTANAAWAAWNFTYLRLKPSALPPWKDPQILNLGLLFLSAPMGMIFGGVAAFRGAPKWLVITLELASLPLLLVGLSAGIAV